MQRDFSPDEIVVDLRKEIAKLKATLYRSGGTEANLGVRLQRSDENVAFFGAAAIKAVETNYALSRKLEWCERQLTEIKEESERNLEASERKLAECNETIIEHKAMIIQLEEQVHEILPDTRPTPLPPPVGQGGLARLAPPPVVGGKGGGGKGTLARARRRTPIGRRRRTPIGRRRRRTPIGRRRRTPIGRRRN